MKRPTETYHSGAYWRYKLALANLKRFQKNHNTMLIIKSQYHAYDGTRTFHIWDTNVPKHMHYGKSTK